LKKVVLISGVNGFLAKTFIELYWKEYRLIGLYNNSKNNVDHSKLSSLIHVENLDKIEENVDFVLHLAAFIPYGKLNTASHKLIESNIQLTYRLYRKFKNSKFVYASSISVYGNPENRVLNEESCFNNPNIYGLSKLAAEAIILNIEKYAIIRYSSIYGSGMYKGSFLPQLVNNAKYQRSIEIYDDGKRLQNYIHVMDAAKICYHTLKHESNGVFLGVDKYSYSSLTVARIIQENFTGTELIIGYDTCYYSYNFNPLYTYERLAFKPIINLEEGIKSIL